MPRKYDHETDCKIATAIRIRRALIGMSQTELGAAIGVSFQQVQKYENGVNRMAASRLWKIAEILGVPMSYFLADPPITLEDNETKSFVSVAKLYHALEPAKQQLVRDFARTLAGVD